MACRTECQQREDDYQLFPKTGQLAHNVNLSLGALRKRIRGYETVYCYIITTAKNRNGRFVQTGSGPNFQGGLMTLCTCKHYMRTFMDPSDWKNKWIAAFTSVSVGNGKNFLIYLMQISQAFESHYELWFSKTISTETKQAKAAHSDKFGDIWKPRRRGIAPFDCQAYIPPCKNHVHAKGWENDIAYVKRKYRVPSLLVGDPRRTFLWDRPKVCYKHRLYRGGKKCNLDWLLDQL